VSRFQHFIVATAGHVDHGKSALVKALTGTDPDRLPEEKARGITIDLGFAHLELPSLRPDVPPFLLGIVDVPGHEDFVKNMVAGVGSVDLALFVVAADDGWMPQTEEHLQILNYLGVPRAVVALTKVDLTQDEEGAGSAIREKLRGTPYADAPIVATSSVSGRGVEELKAALARVLGETPQPRDIAKPRLPVDRVFQLQGVGTVVTGTLTGGALRRGQTVVIQPSEKTTRIRSLQSHSRDVESSGPGTRTALNLTDLAVEDIHRGDVVTLAELGGPSTTLDVLVEISPRAKHPLKDGALVKLHHGSGHSAARVAFFAAKELAPGEHGLAQLRCEEPVFVFAGDRAILRDAAEQRTLAGAVVLDPDASRKGFRSEARRKILDRRAHAPQDISGYVASQLARDGVTRPAELLRKSRFSAEEIRECVSRLTAGGAAVVAGNFVVDAAKWRSLRQKAMEAIDSRHRAHPEQLGLPLNELRATLAAVQTHGEIFGELVADLCRSEFVHASAVIRRTGYRPTLPEKLKAAGAMLRAALAAKPFDPPSRQTLAPDARAQQALRFLIETGEAVEINADVVLAAEALARAGESIRRFLREHGPATVSELRQLLDSSRRVVVPLLERLDRDGITLRQEDKRVLRR
jgi:selenocysteine-specific elongation factor